MNKEDLKLLKAIYLRSVRRNVLAEEDYNMTVKELKKWERRLIKELIEEEEKRQFNS